MLLEWSAPARQAHKGTRPHITCRELRSPCYHNPAKEILWLTNTLPAF